ncbi:MAG: alpha-ketoacid dehydrogenase subunit beta [Candidatus Aminicenantia bacterium]
MEEIRELDFIEAFNEAVAQEMRVNPDIFVIGEDVRQFDLLGFGGLYEEFGDLRVINTPISEEAFVGLAIGAALKGLRPIASLMFVDFIGVCLDMIYNHMAKLHYMSGGQLKVPMVLTALCGGGYQDAAQHSQCLWGTFAHLPGMKVVVPSTAYDVKGLTISAIRDDNPVVLLLHKMLLNIVIMPFGVSGPVPEEPYTVPIGQAAIRREGKDITVITLGLMAYRSLEAAEAVKEKGINVEVLDLRSLVPIDKTVILESVSKTGRVLVVDEDYQGFGLSGEIAALLMENGIVLKHPFRRLCVPDVPIPYTKCLEDQIIPPSQTIQEIIIKMVK